MVDEWVITKNYSLLQKIFMEVWELYDALHLLMSLFIYTVGVRTPYSKE
jgi:hypothetical protein